MYSSGLNAFLLLLLISVVDLNKMILIKVEKSLKIFSEYFK